MQPERQHGELDDREAWRDFPRYVMTYVFVTAICLAIWLIQGADGVVTVRRREVNVGFWPAWPLAIGFVLVAARAWRTFARGADD